MLEIFKYIVKFLGVNGIFGLLTLAIILYFIFCPDKVCLISSCFYRLFKNFSTGAGKKSIAHSIRGNILNFTKHNVDIGNIMPSDLKINWVKEEEQESFISNNQVVIRMRRETDPSENFVSAAIAYVNTGLLHNERRYLSEDVYNASCLVMTRKIVKNANAVYLTRLDEKYLYPLLDSDKELKDLYENIIKIDNNGMFIGIMLNEFAKAANSLYGEIPDPELKAESKEFMRYLYNIAIGVSNNVEDLCFNRDYFKVAIFLTASDRTLRKSGISPFIRHISRRFSEGVNTVYIFALGRKREVADAIAKELSDGMILDVIQKHNYKHINSESGKRVNGVFYECCISKNFRE